MRGSTFCFFGGKIKTNFSKPFGENESSRDQIQILEDLFFMQETCLDPRNPTKFFLQKTNIMLFFGIYDKKSTKYQGGRKPRSAGAPLLQSEQSRTKCEPISTST